MLNRNRTLAEKPQTKVSILLLTYNHEKWISQSIESVLEQQADFSYELVIVEDCSTDSTRDIVIDFQRRYPEMIRLILSESNGEYRTSFAKAYLTSPSQYIVRMDGDDFVTSPHKLQKQADFLDAHTECALCFHNTRVFYEDGSQRPWRRNPPDQKKITTLEDLLLECFIIGPSAMLRTGLFSEFPDWYYAAPWIDWPLYILSAQHGNIAYSDDVMGAYRIHSQGMWSKLDELQQLEELMKFYTSLNCNLDRHYEGTIMRAVSTHCKYYTREYCRRLQKASNERLQASNKQLKELQRILEKERRKSQRRGKRIRNLRMKLQSLDRQLQTTRGTWTQRMAQSAKRINGRLLGR